MGLIHIEMFATLDLVGQAPGGPEEDPEGFAFGGWQAPLVDEVAGAQIGAAYEDTDALLLGRRTYDLFAAYWPHQEGGQDNEIATLFNSVPKYVASRGRPNLSWAGSTHLGPDLPGAVREIRDRHEHVKVVGSLNLVQTLLREKLFDRLDLWVHPIVLGVGKKVFDDGAVPTNVTLLEPPVASPKGTVYLRYGLVDGTPGTGDMAAPDRAPAARADSPCPLTPVGERSTPALPRISPRVAARRAAGGPADRTSLPARGVATAIWWRDPGGGGRDGAHACAVRCGGAAGVVAAGEPVRAERADAGRCRGDRGGRGGRGWCGAVARSGS